MPDSAAKPHAIDAADALLRRQLPTFDELLAGVEPIRSLDELDIPDLTDEERAAFAAALDEDRVSEHAAPMQAAARAVVEAASELYWAAAGEAWERFEQATERLRAALEM